MAEPFAVQRFKAKNDRNGNPRCVYVLYDDNGILMGAWDEGYEGLHALPVEYHLLTRLPDVDVRISEYAEFIKAGRTAERSAKP